MKVLIINTSDIDGGAARAANRLHKALGSHGIDSLMVVQSKSSDDFTVLGAKTIFQKAFYKLRPILDSLPVRRYPDRTKIPFSSSWVPFSDLVDRINGLNPDVVHLHWVAGGFLRIEDLPRINAPLVWTLHDNWGFTGGCHIMWECDRYINSCGSCPRLGSSNDNDLSRKIWQRKSKVFMKLPNMKIVALSNWLAGCAKQSNLFKDHEVICLPNPINTEIYSPVDKFLARNLFNLPNDKKLIAFGAMSATSDVNKGFKELSGALEYLSCDYELVIFGANEPKNSQGFKQKVHYLGHLSDDLTLRVLYSAADVMVVPSLQEAFGQTASEAMACGTPVVAFGATGLLDIVDHLISGYLAKPFDTKDLADGIEWILQNENPKQLSEASRAKVLKEFDSKILVDKYINIYKSLLSI
jgi:glycosyltransferase involved in cell wall biosynthesis